MPDATRRTYRSVLRRLLAFRNTAIFLFKVFPMLPSRPLNWVTPRPIVEQVRYPTSYGQAEATLYRPSGKGRHPGMVVCLGVVPAGVEHPQVARLGESLARSGFAALLHWSPAMRDFQLVPEDIEDIASAFLGLLAHPNVDPDRSGILGTCVGGAFALMAAASPRIRDRVAFVASYASYASIRTLARDISSGSRSHRGARKTWLVDPLTWKVFVHAITASLESEEAERVRIAFATRQDRPDDTSWSSDARAISRLLGNLNLQEFDAAFDGLPDALKSRMTAMSPLNYVEQIRAPLLILLHDRDDAVIPVDEAERLLASLADRPGVRYTEFTIFQHLDPTKGKPAPLPLARELVRFASAIYPLFRQVALRK